MINILSLLGPKKKILSPVNFNQIAVDMHSHLIPGIDDGSKNMDETIALLAKFESLGYKKIITTPHIYSDCYKNTSEIILNGLKDVKNAAKALGLSIEIEAAAEYYCDEHFIDLLEKKDVLTIGGKYVLMEFPFLSEMTNWKDFIFAVQSNGYTPIIAHFERYVYWHGSLKEVTEMKEMGALIQLNLNSLTSQYGEHVKRQAERLVQNQVIDFVSSDCHKIQHLLLMEERASKSVYLHQLIDSKQLKNTELL